MRNSTSLTLLLLISFSSCGQTKADPKKAFEFYDAVNIQIALNKPTQQKFIDKMTMAILAVKENSAAAIDTKELLSLLKYSASKNLEREKNIENLVEVDDDINFKKKTLDYVKTFNDAYQNEFLVVIQIFADAKDNKFERAKDLLFSKLQLIKTKELEMKSSRITFKTKYEELSKSQPIRTGSDYEFVNLRDFKLSNTEIKEGTKIELLSFSGGDDLPEDNIYYKQFIGVNNITGDTLRILALADIQRYDLDKALRIGTYTMDLPIRNQMKPSNNEYIIFNKNQEEIEKGNYKTVFGILKFDE